MDAAENKLSKYDMLCRQMDALIEACLDSERRHMVQIERVHPKYRSSAKNLVHYRAMRSRDLSKLQKRLKNLGFSRLAKAESHVLPSLTTTRRLIDLLEGSPDHEPHITPELSIKKSKRRLRKNSTALLGPRSKNRNSMIMVTMPTEASWNTKLIEDMISGGMGVARINCAHDNSEIWGRIAANVRKVSEELNIPCSIAMDLAGPKIRTGTIAAGPQVKKIRPVKDARGRIVRKASVWLGDEPSEKAPHFLPLADRSKLEPGMVLHFQDTRGKLRTLQIAFVEESGCVALIDRTSYLETGHILYHEKQLITQVCVLGEVAAREGSVYLRPGDKVLLTKRNVVTPHFGPNHDRTGIDFLEIQCTNPSVIDQIKPGESVKFDDGKFEGVIDSVNDDGAMITVTAVRSNGARLKAEKGVNFPDSRLRIQGLTTKDKEDLKFVVETADIVNMSFVNSVRDVKALMSELEKLGALNKIGVVLKSRNDAGFPQPHRYSARSNAHLSHWCDDRSW